MKNADHPHWQVKQDFFYQPTSPAYSAKFEGIKRTPMPPLTWSILVNSNTACRYLIVMWGKNVLSAQPILGENPPPPPGWQPRR